MKRSARNSRWWRRSERGQIFVLTTLGLIVLLGFMGLAVDVGYLKHQKRRMQSAADAAALAGASELKYQTWKAGALRDASLNGFTDGKAGATVTVNNPPVNGPYAGNANYVEAIVSQPQPWFFMRPLGFKSAPVKARAVADLGSARNCFYILAPSGPGIMLDNQGTMNSSCGLIIDSSDSSAVGGGGTINAPSIAFVANSLPSGQTINAATVSKGILPVGDPLKWLPAPAVGSCNHTNFSTNGGALSPGVYCGGINIKGGSVTLGSGMYILLGGGLTMAQNSSLTGTGVTFYNTKDNAHPYGDITVADNTTFNLKAPTSGTYGGILFFQDRSVPASPLRNNVLPGTGLQGALYFPTTKVTYNEGSVSSVAYTIVVSYAFSNQINSFSINKDYSSLADGSPIKATVLSE